MALTSHMVPLGTPAPTFSLPDLDGTPHATADYAGGPGLLVVFACNHCPYVKHVESVLGALLAEYADRLPAVAICTNDAEAYPDDAPDKLAEQRARAKWDFPYLVDADQSVGRAFNAACTPDFFLYGPDLTLAYRGAMDDSTPGNGKPVTGEHLRAAIEHVLKGESVPEPHHPAMGCGIKWRDA
ncbi:thioredoxin family protein [Phytomonospora endophytica]|uniref:Peroxiredoxin n=1 Tax=Phytomonospora endophytica TaxID=714109 RepID=A0A841FS11_9ACTN|nr:thioredoxin family protein [Phytomonospora endophytica]MBB6036538.1 peroxiredoxin [Phytomonospora endophytica]GIG65860.1 thioredoxin family protein [Phytomonospora endophytica]